MASLSSIDLLELVQVSSVSADEALRILEDHGFFYQANTKIGAKVDSLFEEGRQRSVKIDDFKPMLQEDPVSRTRDAFIYCY